MGKPIVKINNCPFCGSESVNFDGDKKITCSKCNNSITGSNIYDVVSAWNCKSFSVREIIESVCEDICDHFCKYRDTCDDNCECEWIRQGNNCPLDKLQ